MTDELAIAQAFVQWVGEVLAQVHYRNWEFHVALDDTRPWLQVRFEDQCTATGAQSVQHGRKWMLSVHMSKSEIVQTALKAVLTAVEHEAREAFTYRGKRIFGPHFDVEELAKLCASGVHLDLRM